MCNYTTTMGMVEKEDRSEIGHLNGVLICNWQFRRSGKWDGLIDTFLATFILSFVVTNLRLE